MLDTSKPGRVKKAVKYRKKGSVCGINGLRGYHVKRISGKGGCGVANPVKLTEVDGVKMTREVSIGCDTAKAFYSWIQKGAKPAVGKKGGGLAKVQVIGGYACRNRNSFLGRGVDMQRAMHLCKHVCFERWDDDVCSKRLAQSGTWQHAEADAQKGLRAV